MSVAPAPTSIFLLESEPNEILIPLPVGSAAAITPRTSSVTAGV